MVERVLRDRIDEQGNLTKSGEDALHQGPVRGNGKLNGIRFQWEEVGLVCRVVASRTREEQILPCPREPPVAVTIDDLRRLAGQVTIGTVFWPVVLDMAATEVSASLAPSALLVLLEEEGPLGRLGAVLDEQIPQLSRRRTVFVIGGGRSGKPIRTSSSEAPRLGPAEDLDHSATCPLCTDTGCTM